MHNEPLDGNEEQKELCFGIKMYQIGGPHICRLPGFAEPEDSKSKKKRKHRRHCNELLMTGRIEHFELERYLLKSMSNESRRLICCKMTISKEIQEAQRLIKHLKHKERCARFKVGSKSEATFFDFYIVPPTKSGRHLSHHFVANHFDANISSKKMWAVVVLPIQSFDAVKANGLSLTAAASPHRSKHKHRSKHRKGKGSPLASPKRKGTAGAPESALDDQFFNMLDGLADALGVDTNGGEGVQSAEPAILRTAAAPIAVVEVPSDPRKRR